MISSAWQASAKAARRSLDPLRAADEQARAVGAARLLLGRRAGVGERLLGADQRPVLAARAADVVEVEGRGEPLGLGIARGRDHGGGQDRLRPLQPDRGPEAGAVAADRIRRVVVREVMGEGEAEAELERRARRCSRSTPRARSAAPRRPRASPGSPGTDGPRGSSGSSTTGAPGSARGSRRRRAPPGGAGAPARSDGRCRARGRCRGRSGRGGAPPAP